MRSGYGVVALALVAGIVISSLSAAPAVAAEGKIKTLLLVGGAVHDWKGIGDVIEADLKESGKFDVTRVNNDLDGFLADRIAPYDLVVFCHGLAEQFPITAKHCHFCHSCDMSKPQNTVDNVFVTFYPAVTDRFMDSSRNTLYTGVGKDDR